MHLSWHRILKYSMQYEIWSIKPWHCYELSHMHMWNFVAYVSNHGLAWYKEKQKDTLRDKGKARHQAHVTPSVYHAFMLNYSSILTWYHTWYGFIGGKTVTIMVRPDIIACSIMQGRVFLRHDLSTLQKFCEDQMWIMKFHEHSLSCICIHNSEIDMYLHCPITAQHFIMFKL